MSIDRDVANEMIRVAETSRRCLVFRGRLSIGRRLVHGGAIHRKIVGAWACKAVVYLAEQIAVANRQAFHDGRKVFGELFEVLQFCPNIDLFGCIEHDANDRLGGTGIIDHLL